MAEEWVEVCVHHTLETGLLGGNPSPPPCCERMLSNRVMGPESPSGRSSNSTGEIEWRAMNWVSQRPRGGWQGLEQGAATVGTEERGLIRDTRRREKR